MQAGWQVSDTTTFRKLLSAILFSCKQLLEFRDKLFLCKRKFGNRPVSPTIQLGNIIA
jgi:hypothetical protein